MNKNKNIIITSVIVAIIAFYGGMKYGQSSAQTGQPRTGQFAGRNVAGGMRNAGGFTGGEVLSKDENSLTIKLRTGGSMIVLYSSSTQIQKSAPGTISDVNVGEQVTIIGSSNADGSLTAQSIQIRPDMASSSPNVVR